jgi:GTPase Era involved in 16S rRNA processing
MNRSVQNLRADLDQVQDILNRGKLSAFSGEDRDRLWKTAADLARKLNDFTDSFLTAGLLGGTGVGKSTLMNALAGAEIASAGHRRPHTDRVLVYRHRSVDLPSTLVRSRVPWDDHVHDADGVRQIVLCDMPDFDSLVSLHLRYVLDFLENLDLLIWVVSPEKYADERFYRFLNEVPKSRENYLFVMNKVDHLFSGPEMEEGYRKLAGVVRTFQHHLAGHGIDNPGIYAVSAMDGLLEPQSAVWNQFPAFRHQVFRERDTKEVSAVKAANLDQEMEGLLEAFDRKVFEAQKLRAILENITAELTRARADWVSSGRLALDAWLERELRPGIWKILHDATALVGVGSIVQVLMRRIEIGVAAGAGNSPLSLQMHREGALGRLSLEWRHIENRIFHRALQEGVETELIAHVKERLDPDMNWTRWSGASLQVVDSRVRSAVAQSSRGFRWVQRATYALITSFLALGLAAHGWGFIPPGGSGYHPGLLWLAGMVHVLFSSEGLAALSSYVLLLLILGFRFHAFQKKRLQHLEQKIIETLKSDLGRAWDAELEEIVHQLIECCGDLDKEAEEISNLRERRGKD